MAVNTTGKISRKKHVARWIPSLTGENKILWKLCKRDTDTSVVVLTTESLNSLILFHREERVCVPCSVTVSLVKYVKSKVPLVCRLRPQNLAASSSFCLLRCSLLEPSHQAMQRPRTRVGVPAQNQHQLPGMWVKTSPDDTNPSYEVSQLMNLSRKRSRHSGAETNHPCYTLSKFLTHTVHERDNGCFTLPCLGVVFYIAIEN